LGAKVRLYGDLVYGKGPQISATITHKQHQDEGALVALGIPRHDDTELQVAATKLWVNGPGNRFWLLHGGLRYSRAAQLGFLGYGGASTDRKWTAEAAVAFFPTREIAIGTEYRQMPDIIPGIPEDDWKDIFVAWFPNKHINITGAWVDTGNVAGVGDQDGWYLSLQGSW
jgi:hypothetical protein